MKFAHLADCHIGSWRDPKLRDISTKAFVRAIDICIQKNVDFILIAGDLFNTSFPRLDNLKSVVSKLKRLKDAEIPVYIVPGSHDYSPSGKTILDVLEEAGLLVNVFKGSIRSNRLVLSFTTDKKTGAKITGMLGKRGSLEKSYYEGMELSHLESESGYKIFLFHSGIDELKPKEMESIISQPLSLLPRNFDYYAGGHVHIVEDKTIEGYGRIAYPGPLFPNSFSELEKLQGGGFYIVENNKAEWEPVQIHNVCAIHIKCDHKTPEQVKDEIMGKISGQEFYNTIVLIRVSGTLESGKAYDINFREIFHEIYSKSAYFAMKSTSMVKTKEFEEIKISAGSVEDVESALVREHMGQARIPGVSAAQEEALTMSLISSLNSEKKEGETNHDFEKRLMGELSIVLGISFN
ncbi:DNA repair exonuclease [Candidatus Woesearchaeota archaeon]|nr:DNA repair exonuclease [Candidatus Woesearchaeota archaeon]